MPAREIIDGLMRDFGDYLMDNDGEVTGTQAETNAYAYIVDESEVTDAEFGDNGNEINFTASIYYAGETDPDRPWCGNRITVEFNGTAKYNDEKWRIEDHNIMSCESNFGNDE
jgi:hypothetical protein